MLRFSQKLQVFIFGLSVGLIIGCLFFIFKLDQFFSKTLAAENRIEKNERTDSAMPIEAESYEKKSSEKKQKSSKYSDSVKVKEKESISKNYTLVGTETSDEVNVLKEELIGVKNVNVKDFDDSKSGSDSVLAELSGISENENSYFMVEFWKTPLNSKGYKMTRNRVLIYGIKDDKDLSIVKFNDHYYLRNSSVYYKINYSSDFKPMERVNEPNLISKLN